MRGALAVVALCVVGSVSTPSWGGAPDAARSADGDSGARSPVQVAGLVIGGFGVTSLAASGALMLMRQGAIRNLEEPCRSDGTECSERNRSAYEQGKTYGVAATATLMGGVGGLAIGSVLVVVASAPTKKRSKMNVRPGVAGAPMGATIVGRF